MEEIHPNQIICCSCDAHFPKNSELENHVEEHHKENCMGVTSVTKDLS